VWELTHGCIFFREGTFLMYPLTCYVLCGNLLNPFLTDTISVVGGRVTLTTYLQIYHTQIASIVEIILGQTC